jgi:hypothetical protein
VANSKCHVRFDVGQSYLWRIARVMRGLLLGRVTCGEQQMSREVCCWAELPVANSKCHVRFAVEQSYLWRTASVT